MAGPADPRTTESWLRLLRCPGLDCAAARRLADRFAGDLTRLAAEPAALAAEALRPEAVREFLRPDWAGIARDQRWLESPGHALVTATDPRYPEQLARLRGAPAALFVRGDPALLATTQVAIVGSRAATPAGRETATDFAARLAAAGLSITSGLAVGIDAAAHRGALAADGITIAVCATGLDDVYPREHAELAERIAGGGALVSEFPTATPPRAAHFPQRNRVLSGLARGVLVVEAAARSGTLITARHAADQGREVMAIPGSIHNERSRGCHRLIRDGAALVESPEDVLATLQIPGLLPPVATQIRGGRLDSGGEILLNALGFEPADLDRIVERTGLAAPEVVSKLQLLELEGRVESLAGGRFCRTPPGRAR